MASEIERLAAVEKAARETADQLRLMSGGVDGYLRNRICTASNRLDKALGRQQSSHGEQF